MRALILALVLLVAAPSVAADAVVVIDTPDSSHVFTDCLVSGVRVDRWSTIVQLEADCKRKSTLAQMPGWLPQPHPDGLPLSFDARIRIRGLQFQECELVSYGRGGTVERVLLECLDDPAGARL